VNVSEAVVGDVTEGVNEALEDGTDMTEGETAKTEADIATVGVTVEEDVGTASPISQVCSGVKLGGEQGILLRKPSRLRVKHWFPGPTPLLTEPRASGKPTLPERVAVESKKNC
jgi:hypothetical protein